MIARAGTPLGASRLRQLVREAAAPQRTGRRRTAAASAPDADRCELCSEAVAPEHRHVLDLESRDLLCACRACSMLLDGSAAGGRHYRLIPDRHRLIEDFAHADAFWAALHIPVEMAFLFFHSGEERIVALYPGPMGTIESLLQMSAWQAVTAENPLLAAIEPDVEALLVNRTDGAREHWLVPLDTCYALVALIRTRWKGLGGGEEVWTEIRSFFDALRTRGEPVDRRGRSMSQSA